MSHANNGDALAQEFSAVEAGLLFFGPQRNISTGLGVGTPLYGCDDVPARHDHRGDDQFLDGVGIATRCIEDDRAVFKGFVQWDVVKTSPTARDDFQALGKLMIMQIHAANHVGIGLGFRIIDLVVSRKFIKSGLGNSVIGFDLVHERFLLAIFFFELLYKVTQSNNTIIWHGVIDACPHAANESVTF